MINTKTMEVINKWRQFPDLDPELKQELNNLNEEQLQDAFYTDLEFGTGGMRGVIGVGTNRMNIYTLRTANYGFAKYLTRNNAKDISVCIAYDCRNKSKEFAIESSRVLALFGIKVYLFDKITPTPELSFAVRYLKANGGIVVTASHNPSIYNGYKIYDNEGCQLVPDLAQIVIDEINNSPDPFTFNLDSYETLLDKKMIEIIGDDVDKHYLEQVKTVSCVNDLKKDNFKIVFTSLHGTSAYLGQRLLTEMGYDFVPVKEQMVADSMFSTVSSPNPEDKRAFSLALEYASKCDADICIATDPDADRVGLAVKDRSNNYHLLNGNQTGALLINYLVHHRKNTNNKSKVVFNTIVTSSLGVNIAKKHGLQSFSTLTGFKFIGEQAHLIENSKDYEFYFGYEESYGYVIKDFVRDKDSLQALLLSSEMGCYYKEKENKNLLEVLEDIYKEYGYYQEDLVNVSLTGEAGAKQIKKVLDYFRGVDNFNSPYLDVVGKEDYLLRIKKDYLNNEVSELTLPVSNVIKYFLNDESWFVLRPSGTEPKMKIYISVCKNSLDESLNRIKEIKENVLKIVDALL